jgi:uncharacterized membrane-anchored protein
MIRRITRVATGFLIAWSAVAGASPNTTSANSLEAERQAAFAAAQAAKQLGPVDVPVRDQAHLRLPVGYVWIPNPAATQLLAAMGNRVGDGFVGAIVPANDAPWFAVVSVVKEGYIKDDDAKDWNADDLLKSLKEGTEAANEERTKRGIPAMDVVGWAQKPHYDASSHRLVWSALTIDKGAPAGEQGVYNTYALGRDGYISLNLVTDAKAIETYKPDALRLLSALEYNDGKKYADFNSSTDKVAAYGLAALVAGAAAKKFGLFAVLLAFIAKFAKVGVLAVAAAAWGATKIFKKKAKAPATTAQLPEDAAAPISDNPASPKS